jgi:diketogulonate reductase-like aldo/keto reductase
VQHGIVVIPKSSRHERIANNADVGELTLSDEEMAALDGLGGR